MIPVEPQPEPENFDAEVRVPGNDFLSKRPAPSAKDFRNRNYWRKIFSELYVAYGRVCAYSCHWIARDSGAGTVDHFRPKSRHPNLAYEWSNYRLANLRYNNRKGNNEDVLDPFEIEIGWFVLDFPSVQVRPGSGLMRRRREQVQATIDRLHLNAEDVLETRLKYLRMYCKGRGSLDLLRELAPFIATELYRQNLSDRIREIVLTE